MYVRWISGVTPKACDCCRARNAALSVTFDDGYVFAVCWDCRP